MYYLHANLCFAHPFAYLRHIAIWSNIFSNKCVNILFAMMFNAILEQLISTSIEFIRCFHEFSWKQAQKDFLPPRAMKGIGYTFKILEIVWEFFWIFFFWFGGEKFMIMTLLGIGQENGKRTLVFLIFHEHVFSWDTYFFNFYTITYATWKMQMY